MANPYRVKAQIVYLTQSYVRKFRIFHNTGFTTK